MQLDPTIYGGIDLPDCWGVDTIIAGILTPTELSNLAAAKLPNGQPVMFLWGYVPLPGDASRWDMTAQSLQNALDAGLWVGLVQHCRSGLWVASQAQGQLDGAHAGQCAQNIGYAPDCHLSMDDESVKNAGLAVSQHVIGWCSDVIIGAQPCIYEGFDPGLSPAQEYAIPNVSRYWGALGNWDVAVRSVCCRQGPQTTVAGITVDTDHAYPDKLGGVLRLMARLDLVEQRMALLKAA